ncbi:MAG: hypothetical protein ACWGQW_12225, partial [bacterium]
LFFGSGYHSRLGTMRRRMAVRNGVGFDRHIHDISSAQFRSKFETDVTSLQYQSLDDLVETVQLPKEKICTYCWDGIE